MKKAQILFSKPARRILGFAMRKQAKRCKAQPQQVSLVNLCFASRVGEIRLERLSNSRGAAIKDLSRKAESKKSQRQKG